MSTATTSQPKSETTDDDRVQDSGMSLWLVTAVILVLGYVALRELSGATDGPKVEKQSAEQVVITESVETESPEDAIHTIRPMTSSDVLPIDVIEPTQDDAVVPTTQSPFLELETWSELPSRIETASGERVVK